MTTGMAEGQSCTQRSDPGRFTKIAGASERPQSTTSLWRSLQVSRQRGCFALLYPCRYHFQWVWSSLEKRFPFLKKKKKILCFTNKCPLAFFCCLFWPCLSCFEAFANKEEDRQCVSVRRLTYLVNDGSDSTCGDAPHPAANAKPAAGARFVLPPTLSVLLHMTKWNTSLPLGESCGKCRRHEW
ncbi:uncharacterized protein B0T23DRAFT_216791 [Neurospora hispaniola]|uniref:Uncharacterized protein n=1 Tax=Neurospora hispaniola TaxID=588809 RepID=A0AAJ0MNI6_9PEZI|nr:hypothetical protein B0T23DRAFT_216791 [Neurospora hispaniola]